MPFALTLTNTILKYLFIIRDTIFKTVIPSHFAEFQVETDHIKEIMQKQSY